MISVTDKYFPGLGEHREVRITDSRVAHGGTIVKLELLIDGHAAKRMSVRLDREVRNDWTILRAREVQTATDHLMSR